MEENADPSPFKLPYVFGSSTPRQFSYMDHVPPELQIYDARLSSSRRNSRLTREQELATFREFMTQARCQSASPSAAFRRRGRSTDPAAHYRRHRSRRRHPPTATAADSSTADDETSDEDCDGDFLYDTDNEGQRIRRRYDYEYVFGSSTPRKWSHMAKLPVTLRIYDVELFPHLRRHFKRCCGTKKRSQTVCGQLMTTVSDSLSASLTRKMPTANNRPLSRERKLLKTDKSRQERDNEGSPTTPILVATDDGSSVKPIINKSGDSTLSIVVQSLDVAAMPKSISNGSSVLADDERSSAVDIKSLERKNKQKKIVSKSERSSPRLTIRQPADQQTMLFFSEVASQLDANLPRAEAIPSLSINHGYDQSKLESPTMLAGSLECQANACLDYATIRSIVLSDDAVQFTSGVQKGSALDNARLIISTASDQDSFSVLKDQGEDSQQIDQNQYQLIRIMNNGVGSLDSDVRVKMDAVQTVKQIVPIDSSTIGVSPRVQKIDGDDDDKKLQEDDRIHGVPS